ncbi:MAG: hypothetical protein EHM48_03295 [Planctomycetaceae bacterium]|nr:MAG: hypothetical protein EHM48_03295 [Planctomycetaceae bacterium]
MNEAVVRTKLADFMDMINGLDTFNRDKPPTEQGSYVSDIPHTDRPLEEILGQLQLQIRYLTFDIEATRRENKYLRQMLESRPNFRRDEDTSQNPPE